MYTRISCLTQKARACICTYTYNVPPPTGPRTPLKVIFGEIVAEKQCIWLVSHWKDITFILMHPQWLTIYGVFVGQLATWSQNAKSRIQYHLPNMLCRYAYHLCNHVLSSALHTSRKKVIAVDVLLLMYCCWCIAVGVSLLVYRWFACIKT